jgi:hypothetical protein
VYLLLPPFFERDVFEADFERELVGADLERDDKENDADPVLNKSFCNLDKSLPLLTSSRLITFSSIAWYKLTDSAEI